ncbi:McrC family protein [Burkholderia sp. S171]|uniref:McrC family protein n=1 Tax=Burkholderia sp. S171 TaxID=1641860 RepID=UPI00131DA08B|nr:hypothetical protein [Burkholderia sp. S171]
MNRRHLIVREHQTLRREPYGLLSSDAHTAFLRHLAALPPNALTPTHDGLRTGSLCGLVSVDGWTLEILPKIYDQADHTPDRGLLVKMLASCFDIPIWHGDNAESGQADLLTAIVRAYLEEASTQMSAGWIKSYVTEEDQLTRPRGQLKIHAQVRRGRAQGHMLHCEFDELTTNNAHNRLVKAALKVAASKIPTGSRHAVMARRLALSLNEVDDSTRSWREPDSLAKHRLTQRYERLLILSSWLLRLLGPNVHRGPERGISLLFDMNRLFQDYVGNALDRAIRRHPLANRLRLTRERPVKGLVSDSAESPRFMLRPDLCVHFDNQMLAILDTKWKRLLPDEQNAGVGQSDLYQLLAYGHTYGCRQLTLIYPDHPCLEQWPRPRFKFAPYEDAAIGLSIETFDIQNSDLSADRILVALSPQIEPAPR